MQTKVQIHNDEEFRYIKPVANTKVVKKEIAT